MGHFEKTLGVTNPRLATALQYDGGQDFVTHSQGFCHGHEVIPNQVKTRNRDVDRDSQSETLPKREYFKDRGKQMLCLERKSFDRY